MPFLRYIGTCLIDLVIPEYLEDFGRLVNLLSLGTNLGLMTVSQVSSKIFSLEDEFS